ncbi:MAG: DUF2073 domain-containing protein [Candidatus Pacearchaeota archaeon]
MAAKIAGLTIRFITYSELERLPSQERIKKILDLILENKIVILQGRLSPIEESSLIQSTMALAGRIKGFKGVELAVLTPTNENKGFFDRLRSNLANVISKGREGLTIIGPATIVKQIKKDPSKVELMLRK